MISSSSVVSAIRILANLCWKSTWTYGRIPTKSWAVFALALLPLISGSLAETSTAEKAGVADSISGKRPILESYDLVVVGGTPGGIACAVMAARQGLTVLLVNPTQHLGGFMTSGCGGWEAPYDGIRSPIFDEIKKRIAQYYRAAYGDNSPQYLASIPDPATRSRFGRPKVEPRVCEMILDQMVKEESRLTVLKGFFVSGANRQNNLLKSIGLKARSSNVSFDVAASVFADCTYEGDLAAMAKVPFRIGREARNEYDEPHAGIIFTKIGPKKTTTPGEAVSYPFNLRLVGERQWENGLEILEPESTGQADPNVMCYNYRLILTKNPENRIAVKKPANYDQGNFEASNRSILPGLPNDKIAWNGAGRLIGPQRDYPEADWKTREEISQRHLDAALSWLWYVQNDPAAQPEEREFWKDYGLAKDEFVDNDHLPYEIYVREARRIVGRYVFSEHDATKGDGIERAPIHSDSIAITDWPFDSTTCTAAVARKDVQEGRLMAADVWVPAQVPFRTILPQGLDNLLVPVCLSATHVGWGTIRLEPVWIQTGEAAGLAAALAIKAGIPPAEVDPHQLMRALVERRAMVSFFNDVDLGSNAPWNAAVQYLGANGFFGSYEASPNKLLTRDLADRWVSSFSKLAVGDKTYSATKEASLLPTGPSEETNGSTVTAEILSQQLKAALKNVGLDEAVVEEAARSQGLDANPQLSRGEACLLMYAILGRLNK